MKKLSLWLFLTAFAFGSLCTARVNDDEESERSERRARREQREKDREARREQERLEHEKRHEERRMKREQREAERKQKEAAHKAEKEQRNAEREQRRADRHMSEDQEHREREQRRAERRALREQKEHDRQMRDEQDRQEREKRREARRQKHEERKAKKAKTEKPYRPLKRDAESIRQERREKRHDHGNREKEKTTRRRLERESKARRGEEKSKSRHESCLKNYAEMSAYWHDKRHEKYDKIHAKRADRVQKIAQWKKMRKDMLHEDAAAGAYADLYKSPTWPTSALFFEKPTLLNISLDYKYACDCYGSSGQGSKHNITKLTYGENPIRVQDILLASKLVTMDPPEAIQYDSLEGGTTLYDHNKYLNYLANELINLKGRSESWGMSFDFSRYIISNNVAVGCEIPVAYKRNRLRIHTKLSDAAIKPNGNLNDGAFGPISSEVLDIHDVQQDLAAANIFLRRYGADLNHFVDDVLNAKGIYQLGGSTVGLGDVAVFINGQMNSALYDKLIVGLRAQFPTGKKAAMHKLWAPDLGNGGFTEISGYGSVLFSCTKYLNPHFLADVSFGLPAHVNRRVPRRINLPAVEADDEVPGRTVNEVNALLKDAIALGDRVVRAQENGSALSDKTTAVAIDDYDSIIRNFGDKVTNVRITKGSEFKLRAGNMFEGFILARGFLDLFYDFRGKLKDNATGLAYDKYDVDSLVKDTVQLEHRIGFDWSYQADLFSRVHLGMLYTFAGRNVPKTIEVTGTFNYSF